MSLFLFFYVYVAILTSISIIVTNSYLLIYFSNSNIWIEVSPSEIVSASC